MSKSNCFKVSPLPEIMGVIYYSITDLENNRLFDNLYQSIYLVRNFVLDAEQKQNNNELDDCVRKITLRKEMIIDVQNGDSLFALDVENDKPYYDIYNIHINEKKVKLLFHFRKYFKENTKDESKIKSKEIEKGKNTL